MLRAVTAASVGEMDGGRFGARMRSSTVTRESRLCVKTSARSQIVTRRRRQPDPISLPGIPALRSGPGDISGQRAYSLRDAAITQRIKPLRTDPGRTMCVSSSKCFKLAFSVLAEAVMNRRGAWFLSTRIASRDRGRASGVRSSSDQREPPWNPHGPLGPGCQGLQPRILRWRPDRTLSLPHLGTDRGLAESSWISMLSRLMSSGRPDRAARRAADEPGLLPSVSRP